MHIVTTHRNTDLDGLASVVAVTILFPGTTPVLPRIVNPNVAAFLSIHKDLFGFHQAKEIDLDSVDRLTVVDTNSWVRLDGLDKLRAKESLEIHLWDHHQNHGDIAASWRCQEEMGATATLLVRVIRESGKRLDSIQATLLLAGIYEDTGSLSFPSTRSEDAYAAGFLLDSKADLNVLNSFLRPAYGETQKNILFEMLQTAKRVKLRGCTFSINTCQISGHIGNLSGVVQTYRDILNVDAAVCIFHDREKERCMVIGRCSTDSLDMGEIMRQLGGGGHPRAGSATMKSIEAECAAERIQSLIEGYQKPAVQIGDLMSFPVFTVEPKTPMSIVAGLLREKGVSGIPVVDDGQLAGMISRRDFRKIKRESQLSSPVKAFMSSGVKTIEPDASPLEAARLMVKHDIGRLPVVEKGRMIGILTRSDAMRYFYDLPAD